MMTEWGGINPSRLGRVEWGWGLVLWSVVIAGWDGLRCCETSCHYAISLISFKGLEHGFLKVI